MAASIRASTIRLSAKKNCGSLRSIYSAPVMWTHGGTNAQPGPRKNVPTMIRTTLTTTNSVKARMAHFRSAGRRLGFEST